MGNRIFYIDALKALAILLVVTGHIFIGSFRFTETFVYRFIDTTNMGLFMFVSGFLAYKAGPRQIGRDLGKKALALLIPFLSVGLLFTLYKGAAIETLFTNSMHHGYWFTYSLFMMFAVYYLLDAVLKQLSRCIRFPYLDVLFWGVTLCLIYGLYAAVPISDQVKSILSSTLFIGLFHCFIYGTILRSNERLRSLLLEKDWIFAGSLLALVASWVVWVYPPPIFMLIQKLLWINVIVRLFYKWFGDKESRAVSFVAGRTLDIYVFHYFLLPVLPFVCTWFDMASNPLLSFCLAAVLALFPIAASLGVSEVVRSSPILSFALLGVKKRKKPVNLS